MSKEAQSDTRQIRHREIRRSLVIEPVWKENILEIGVELFHNLLYVCQGRRERFEFRVLNFGKNWKRKHLNFVFCDDLLVFEVTDVVFLFPDHVFSSLFTQTSKYQSNIDSDNTKFKVNERK